MQIQNNAMINNKIAHRFNPRFFVKFRNNKKILILAIKATAIGKPTGRNQVSFLSKASIASSNMIVFIKKIAY